MVIIFFVLLQTLNVRGVAQLASALAWGARGRKFESSYPDDCKRTIEKWFSFFTLSIITLKKTRC